jgi:hypothetical protein
MTSFRFAREPHDWLRTISRKTLAACIAGVILASTIAHGEVPVRVPKATEWLLAQQQAANIRLVAFQLIALAIPPLLFVHGFRRAPAPDVRIYLRPPVVFDSHALRLRLSASDLGDRTAFRLFCRLYPAAWMGSRDLAECAEGRRRATCCRIGPRVAVHLATLLIDR